MLGDASDCSPALRRRGAAERLAASPVELLGAVDVLAANKSPTAAARARSALAGRVDAAAAAEAEGVVDS